VEIFGDRRRERRTVGTAIIGLRTLTQVPAEVEPVHVCGYEVDLLNRALPDIGDVEIARDPVERIAERVAQARHPDLRRAAAGRERVAGRNSVVARCVGGKTVA